MPPQRSGCRGPLHDSLPLSEYAGLGCQLAIVGDPDLLIGPDPKLQKELDAKWAVEDTQL